MYVIKITNKNLFQSLIEVNSTINKLIDTIRCVYLFLPLIKDFYYGKQH